MTRYDRVKEILDNAVQGKNIAAHGPFWRNLARDEFVAKFVFGRKLVKAGDGPNSNLIHALRGEMPFGRDSGNPGASFPRMPAGFPPVPDDDISFIERWITEGCLEDPFLILTPRSTTASSFNPAEHNAFWRAFDNWSNFQRTGEVEDAINAFFSVAQEWLAASRDGDARLAAWDLAIRGPRTQAAITLLARQQEETVKAFYGTPPVLAKLLDSFERFGDGTLPADPLRPQDVNHSMNGEVMWFYWSAFADATVRLGIQVAFWHLMMRAILLGLLNDGVFRERFPVVGFTKDAPGKQAMRDLVSSIAEDALSAELQRRFADTGIAP